MVFCCKISIFKGNTDVLKYTFSSANEIEINKTWKKYTQTATIRLPKNINIRQNGVVTPLEEIRNIFLIGDKIKIELGYNLILRTEFEGYITEVFNGLPYEIICQDEMYLFKQNVVSIDIEDATVRQILEAAAPNHKIYCADEIYGDFSVSQVPAIQVFEELKKKAGLYTFFRGKRLVCGLPYSDQLVSKVVPNFVLGKNIIESDLRILKNEDSQVKIYGKSIQNDGSVLSFDKGEEGGAIYRINYDYELKKEDLQQIVKNKYEYYKKLGSVSGSIKTFGFPFVEHGQEIFFVDDIREKIREKFFIDEIQINVSTSGGYKKEIKPGKVNYK